MDKHSFAAFSDRFEMDFVDDRPFCRVRSVRICGCDGTATVPETDYYAPRTNFCSPSGPSVFELHLWVPEGVERRIAFFLPGLQNEAGGRRLRQAYMDCGWTTVDAGGWDDAAAAAAAIGDELSSFAVTIGNACLLSFRTATSAFPGGFGGNPLGGPDPVRNDSHVFCLEIPLVEEIVGGMPFRLLYVAVPAECWTAVGGSVIRGCSGGTSRLGLAAVLKDLCGDGNDGDDGIFDDVWDAASWIGRLNWPEFREARGAWATGHPATGDAPDSPWERFADAMFSLSDHVGENSSILSDWDVESDLDTDSFVLKEEWRDADASGW